MGLWLNEADREWNFNRGENRPSVFTNAIALLVSIYWFTKVPYGTAHAALAALLRQVMKHLLTNAYDSRHTHGAIVDAAAHLAELVGRVARHGHPFPLISRDIPAIRRPVILPRETACTGVTRVWSGVMPDGSRSGSDDRHSWAKEATDRDATS